MTRTAFVLMIPLLALTPLAAQDTPVQTVSSVDLDRYVGDWYEVARLPNDFQDQCAGDVRVTYEQREDGRIDVTNRCRTEDGDLDVARGVARIAEPSTNAKLEVRFAPVWLSFIGAVWGDYWIIGLDPQYRWAVVGEPDRQNLWILSRTPSLEASAYEEALERARQSGYQLDALRRTDNSGLQR